jgi:hypothetical protein
MVHSAGYSNVNWPSGVVNFFQSDEAGSDGDAGAAVPERVGVAGTELAVGEATGGEVAAGAVP